MGAGGEGHRLKGGKGGCRSSASNANPERKERGRRGARRQAAGGRSGRALEARTGWGSRWGDHRPQAPLHCEHLLLWGSWKTQGARRSTPIGPHPTNEARRGRRRDGLTVDEKRREPAHQRTLSQKMTVVNRPRPEYPGGRLLALEDYHHLQPDCDPQDSEKGGPAPSRADTSPPGSAHSPSLFSLSSAHSGPSASRALPTPLAFLPRLRLLPPPSVSQALPTLRPRPPTHVVLPKLRPPPPPYSPGPCPLSDRIHSSTLLSPAPPSPQAPRFYSPLSKILAPFLGPALPPLPKPSNHPHP